MLSKPNFDISEKIGKKSAKKLNLTVLRSLRSKKLSKANYSFHVKYFSRGKVQCLIFQEILLVLSKFSF